MLGLYSIMVSAPDCGSGDLSSILDKDMIVLETHLRSTFHGNNRRLWQKIGTGSYSLSDEAIQVRNPMTNQPSTSSFSFLTH